MLLESIGNHGGWLGPSPSTAHGVTCSAFMEADSASWGSELLDLSNSTVPSEACAAPFSCSPAVPGLLDSSNRVQCVTLLTHRLVLAVVGKFPVFTVHTCLAKPVSQLTTLGGTDGNN